MRRIGTIGRVIVLAAGMGLAAAGTATARDQTASGQTARDQAAPMPRPRPAAAPAPAAIDPRVRAFLPATQALFEGFVRDDKMPGIVAGFGIGDMPTLFPAAGRIGDEPGAAPAGPDSLWRIYSMTKPVTGIAAMILVEEGKLRLDQPVSDFFPEFARMRVLTHPDTSLESVPARTPITIRHLLTHTSGLGYSISAKGPLLKEYERLGILPATLNSRVEAIARRTRPATLAAFAARVAEAPLVYEPGTRFHYAIGLDVLGAVIEKASGMPFDRFLNDRLFMPLGMSSTGFMVAPEDRARFATNYVFIGDIRTPIDPSATSVYLSPPSFPYGGAGLVSSARDYDRFLHMLQNGGTLGGRRILKPETAALAMSNLLPPGIVFAGLGSGTGGTMTRQMGFGAGGSVYLEDGPNGFPSKGTFGWGGAAGTIAFVDPVRRFRASIMVNYMPDEKWGLRQEIPVALMKDAARFHAEQR